MKTPNSNDQLIEGFCAHLLNEGKKGGTVQNYRSDLRTFSEWVGSEYRRCLAEVGEPELKSYRRYLMENFGRSTVNRRVAATNRFFRWAKMHGIIEEVPCKLKTLRMRKPQTGLPENYQIAKVWKAVDEEGNAQNRLILKLLSETDLQLSELCGIRWVDLEFSISKAELWVQNTIPHRWRRITLSRVCRDLFSEIGYPMNVGRPTHVFKTGEGLPISPRAIQMLVERVAKAAGIKLTTQILRRIRHRSLEDARTGISKNHPLKLFRTVAKDAGVPMTWHADITEGRKTGDSREDQMYDTFQDIHFVDLIIYGSELSEVFVSVRSGVVRDLGIRRAVLNRAHGKCERCRFHAQHAGMLEVHHIISAPEKQDRYHNCVALCPICHRLAHSRLYCASIEQELLGKVLS